MKKDNVLVYMTNGNIKRYYVACPAVGTLNQGNQLILADHCGYQVAVDDYEEWYEDVDIFWATEVIAIYCNNKCEWHNPNYITK